MLYFDSKLLKFVPEGPIQSKSLTWYQPGDKPLSEPMMTNLVMVLVGHSKLFWRQSEIHLRQLNWFDKSAMKYYELNKTENNKELYKEKLNKV